MLNLYPKSEKLVKRVIDILNIVGYLLGTLTGVGAGFALGALLKACGAETWIFVFGGWLAAFVVAGLIIFAVWMSGLLLWTWSNMADDVRQVRRMYCEDDPEEGLC